MKRPPWNADHTLVRAGRNPARFTPDGALTAGRGCGHCTCGASSDPGLTIYSIVQWHRDHRLDILADR